MNIYQSKSSPVNNQPYTYLIGWSKLNRWYYGSRYSKKCHPSDLWVTYFTSSKSVAKFRKLFGEPDIIQVRKTFSSPLSCYQWESKVLHRINAIKDPKWLNKCAGYVKTGVYPSGNHLKNTISVVAPDGSIVRVDQSLVDMSKMHGIAKGKTCVKDIHTGEVKQVAITDVENTSSLVGIAKGTVVVRDKQGLKFRVAKDDPRYLSQELVNNKSKMCYAVDNQGVEHWIKKSDTRLKWTQLTWVRDCPYNTTQNQVRKGLISCRDASGNNYRVLKTDPRLQRGELVYHKTHMCIVTDNSNNTYWIPLKDKRIGKCYQLQYLCPHNPNTDYLKGSIHVVIDGVKTRIKSGDPRIAAGIAVPYSTRNSKSS